MSTIPMRRADNSEILPYNFSDYYVFTGVEKLSDHPNNTMFSHWHDDVEFVVPVRGHMIYNINGDLIHLEPNKGVFINAQQIHHGYSDDDTDCEFIYALWHPLLLCATSGIERTFVKPVLSNASIPYIPLTNDIGWENEILSSLYEMQNCLQRSAAPLILQSIIYKIWFTLYENTYQEQSIKPPLNHQLSILKNMLSYVHENYANKIYLADIANAGNVSISCCNIIYKKYLDESPIRNLLKYRLMRSCEFLKNTDQSITEIAYEVGFLNLSYFIDSFRKEYAFTPAEYRKSSKPLN